MGLIVMMFAGLMISLISNELSSNSQAIRENRLMEQQKENQSELNEEAFERQSEFWKENQSPNALYDQYRGLGASQTAALQSILGLSPASPITASSGSAAGGQASAFSTLPQMLDALQNMQNSQFQNENTAALTENIILQNEWLPRMNQGTLDSMYGHLEIDYKTLGLDRDIFENVTKPLAASTINLNASEIAKNQQTVKNLCAQRLEILQQIETLKAQERNYDASSNLMRVEADKVYNETGLIKQQTLTEEQETTLKQLEVKLKSIDTELSEFCGVNVTLPWQNVGIESAERTSLNIQIEKTKAFEKASEAAYNEAQKVLSLKGKAYRAYKKQKEFFQNYKDKSDQFYHRVREKSSAKVKDYLENWDGYSNLHYSWDNKY